MNLNDLGEKQSKVILERIHQTEKNSQRLLESLKACSFKNLKVRDKTDDLAKTFKDISENEQFNHSIEKALDKLSIGLTFTADLQTTQVERVDEKIISELAQYHTICQNTKEEIKNQISLRDREIAKRKQLDVSKRSENEIILSNMQFLKIMKEISMISEQFETQKVADFKDCLKNFVLIQLKYHASCLEIFSNLYQDVSFVDEDKDAEQFKKHFQLNPARPQTGFFLTRMKSQSLSSLGVLSTKKSRMREKSARLKNLNQSSVSLNSNDSETEIRKESQAIEISADSLETKSESEDDQSDSETNVEEQGKTKIQQVKRYQ